MGTAKGRLAGISRAAEARRRNPVQLAGQACPVGMGSRVRPMDRARVGATLQDACPRGLSYLYRHLCVSMVSVGDFEAACGHFGLRGVLRDITGEEVAVEVRARRERGDEPSTGYLPLDLDSRFPREEADARIAIVKRRIAEARAKAPKIPAPPHVA